MKRFSLILITMIMFLSGAQAQKKNVPTVKSSASATAVATPSKVIQLPEPEVGMDLPLREALKKRRTVRDFRDDELPQEFISSLLWCTYGFNRPDEHKRVVPSAVNVQEFDIYLFTKKGCFLYDAEKNTLTLTAEGDHRSEISKQKHFAVAPISIVIVANYDRMTNFKQVADRDFYADVDCGYVSQNIYLFCASAEFGTVACGGIDREHIAKILKIKNGKVMLAHPVGMIQ